jgi:ATP-dependent NAD(P)H-hydrate dehydratase
MIVISQLLKSKTPSFGTFQKTFIGIAALSSTSFFSSTHYLCEAFHTETGGNSSRINQSTCSLGAHESTGRSGMMWDDLRQEAMKKAVLPMSEDSYKGSSGRIAVLGGSARYTGAPFYAAMASLKAGADLAYVFTATEAALPIKSYSPELMVAPVYTAADFDRLVQQEPADLESETAQALVKGMVDQVVGELDRLHCLVVGPGMGRCPLVMKAVASILVAARQRNLHVVLDADALFMMSLPEYQGILPGYDKAVLTPNIVEYKRLFPAGEGKSGNLNHVTVVRKGKVDEVMVVQDDDDVGENEQQPQAISHRSHLTCSEPGGLKRSGGIGDVLAGTLGTTVAWHSILVQRGVASANDLPLSCWTACCFVKRATNTAFQAKRRSMTAPDVLEALGASIDQMTN